MPTSYTSLLGLALPVTGELSGTWGDTVNDYITKYVDAAVAGAQTISGSQTAVTLSTANGTALTQAGAGATGSAQYQILNCTGNPAGLLTITAPAASKVYLVINATSTSQSVKVVGTGPTTGVTIAASRAALITWNGSDFRLIATTDASQLSGILAVANGGTGLSSGTSGGVPYFSGTTTMASSAALAANAIVLGGGAGSAPATTTTGTGVVTAVGNAVNTSGGLVTQTGTLAASSLLLGGGASTAISSTTTGTGVVTAVGNAVNTSGGLVTQSGTLAASSLLLGGGASTAISSTTTGTGVVTALGTNVGTAGAFVVNGGALGTPSSGTVTNLTGTASININGTVGATTPNTGAFTSITSTSASGILTRAAANQDGVALVGRAGGTLSYEVTLTPTTLSADRTLTLPDASGTILQSGTAVTVAQGGTGITSGTSGGVPYFSSTSAIASSAALAANALVVGGGAGAAPSTITTGTGVVTALGVNTGTAGAFVVNGGALGTPSSGTVTNLTGTASININGTVGATTPNTGAFTTVSASGVATFSAGSAAAPAITTTGDTNTGIFFPAADTIAFAEGGVEAMRINSSGNVGIGTTSPTTVFNVYSSTAAANIRATGDGVNTTFSAFRYDSTANGPTLILTKFRGSVAAPTAVANGDLTGTVGFYAYGGTNQRAIAGINGVVDTYTSDTNISGYLSFLTNSGSTAPSETMRLDSSGNLGIGTSSPSTYGDLAVYRAKTGVAAISVTQQNAATNDGAKLSTYYQTTETASLKYYWDGSQFQGQLYSYGPLAFLNGASPTERMRLDSSGNLGIGATPSAWSGAVPRALQFGSNAAVNAGAALYLTCNGFYNGTNWIYQNTDLASYYIQNVGNHQWFSAASGTAGNTISFTERMRITSGGDVGIGTSSPSGKLDVVGSGGTFRVGSAGDAISFTKGGTNYIGTSTAGGQLLFQTGASVDRMIIESDGDVGIGTTTPGARLHVEGGALVAKFIRTTAGGNSEFKNADDAGYGISFLNAAGTTAGSIYWTATTTTYATSSDERLKENIVDAPQASAIIDNIKVRSFDWKADGVHQRFGVIAQELEQVAPEAVGRPAGDDNQFLGVDYSKLVPMLIKEIQSLRARVAALESKGA